MGGLFADGDFRRLWLSGAISSAVRWLDALAFSIVAYQASGSAFIVAMLLMLRLLPMGLFGAVLGTLGESMQRRALMLIVLAGLGATSCGLFLLASSGRLAIWHLAVAAFINGIGWASDSTVRRLTLSDVAGAARVSAAVAFDSASANLSRLLGPTAGGVLVAWVGVETVFAIDVGLYAIAFAALWGLRQRNTIASRGAGVVARILEGVALVRRDPRLVGTMVLTVVFNLFAWPATSMVPVLGQGRLGLGAEGTGILVSMDGLGALAASLLIGIGVKSGWYARVYLGGIVLYFVMEIVLGLATTPALAGAAVFMTGVAAAAFGIMQSTLVYLATPADMRSRVFGVLTACIGLGPLGFVHIGLLADWLSAPWATVLVGIEGFLALALTWRWWAATIR